RRRPAHAGRSDEVFDQVRPGREPRGHRAHLRTRAHALPYERFALVQRLADEVEGKTFSQRVRDELARGSHLRVACVQATKCQELRNIFFTVGKNGQTMRLPALLALGLWADYKSTQNS